MKWKTIPAAPATATAGADSNQAFDRDEQVKLRRQDEIFFLLKLLNSRTGTACFEDLVDHIPDRVGLTVWRGRICDYLSRHRIIRRLAAIDAPNGEIVTIWALLDRGKAKRRCERLWELAKNNDE